MHLKYTEDIVVLFQFQYGSIKRETLTSLHTTELKFQFQYGSIKSKPLLKEWVRCQTFQFQYGSIKRQFGNKNYQIYCVVSIPIWFN